MLVELDDLLNIGNNFGNSVNVLLMLGRLVDVELAVDVEVDEVFCSIVVSVGSMLTASRAASLINCIALSLLSAMFYARTMCITFYIFLT